MLKQIQVEISNTQRNLKVEVRQLKRTVQHVLSACSVKQGQVSIAVVNNATIQQLKRRFLGKREVTDVISFDLADQKCLSDGAVDCEVVINAEQAAAVATERSSDPLAELNLYLVHGLLHQLGYDDRKVRGAQLMHEKEDQLLTELGFGRVYTGKR